MGKGDENDRWKAGTLDTSAAADGEPFDGVTPPTPELERYDGNDGWSEQNEPPAGRFDEPGRFDEQEPDNGARGAAPEEKKADPWPAFEAVPLEWLEVAPPPRRWLLMGPPEPSTDATTGKAVERRSVSGMLGRGLVGLLAAGGGAGKTMAVVDLAVAVATDGTWLGAFPVSEGGRVLLLLGEEDGMEVRRRLWSVSRELDARARALVSERVFAVGLAGHSDIALSQSEDSGEGARTAAAVALIERVKASGPWALIVIDPLSRFAGPDTEKDNAAATRLVQIVEGLTATDDQPTVLVCCHTSQAARQAGSSDATGIRGVTGLGDGGRFAAMLTEDPALPGFVTFTVSKSNYASKPHCLLRRRNDGRLSRANAADVAELEAMKKDKAVRDGLARKDKEEAVKEADKARKAATKPSTEGT